MADRKDKKKSRVPGGGKVNPFRDTTKPVPPAGADAGREVNPSGPTSGTEGWGAGPGEANTTHLPHQALGERELHTEARRADDTGAPPAPRHGDAGTASARNRTFRCADMGNADYRWEISGPTEDALMPHIEQHARERHGVPRFDEKTRRHIHDVIRERSA